MELNMYPTGSPGESLPPTPPTPDFSALPPHPAPTEAVVVSDTTESPTPSEVDGSDVEVTTGALVFAGVTALAALYGIRTGIRQQRHQEAFTQRAAANAAARRRGRRSYR